MKYKNLNALGQLLGCYFHQDWFEEFESDIAALHSIVESEPKERLSAGVAEIDGLLMASLPENELKTILTDEVGCYFEPTSQGITYTEWLKRVRQKFAH